MHSWRACAAWQCLPVEEWQLGHWLKDDDRDWALTATWGSTIVSVSRGGRGGVGGDCDLERGRARRR